MLTLVKHGSPEWKEARKCMITASLAAACLGLHPWISRQKAWRLIMGLEEMAVNPNMQWGLENEKRARADYEAETGQLVQTVAGFWVHDTFPWLGASPDCLISTDGMAEFKCPEKLPEAMPPHYEIQVRIQLACTGRAWCDFYSWTPEGHFKERIERMMPDESILIKQLTTFHSLYILGNTQPPRKKRT